METPRILQQTPELIQPVKTSTVTKAEKIIEPTAVENKISSLGSKNFKPGSLFIRNWPELKKARKIKRNNAKSISTIKVDSKMKFLVGVKKIRRRRKFSVVNPGTTRNSCDYINFVLGCERCSQLMD